MDEQSKTNLPSEVQSFTSMIRRSEAAIARLAFGTSQQTLIAQRIFALKVARSLLSREGGVDMDISCSNEDLKKALAPLSSLLIKSEKAQKKVAQGTWQHAMLERNLTALRIAIPLLIKAIESKDDGSAEDAIP